jgi:RNA polymerase II C-terminal domain phosphatase-like 1/2
LDLLIGLQKIVNQLSDFILLSAVLQIKDASVFIRSRPAWEDLHSYLIARGSKCFEVYVCAMPERDYALKMWRLLNPDLRLINFVQLHDRMVYVTSGM